MPSTFLVTEMASDIRETPFVKQLAANGMCFGSFTLLVFALFCLRESRGRMGFGVYIDDHLRESRAVFNVIVLPAFLYLTQR